MRELLDVLEAAARLDGTARPFVVATVVATSGSTYRSPGARQLVSASSSVGTVSGGCLDSQTRDTAAEVMATGQPRLDVYDLTVDDDLVWGWGLGCSGVTEVLFEPAASFRPLAAALRSSIASDEPVTQVTLLDVDLGARMIFTTSGAAGSLGALDDSAASAVGNVATGVTEIDGVRAFVEVVRPPNRLVVSGANNDARPLVAAASDLGWRPIVLDPRPRLLTHDRFESAHMMITVEPGAMGTVLDLDDRTFVVLMNHNFIRDGDALASVLGTDVAYIGLLGPAQRAEQLLKYAAEQGVVATDADLAKIHGPAGLDIGAEGPLEIGWSIMSEVLAKASGRDGGSLRDR